MGRSKISRDVNLRIVLNNYFVRGIVPLFLCPSQFPFTPVPSAVLCFSFPFTLKLSAALRKTGAFTPVPFAMACSVFTFPLFSTATQSP